MITKTFWLSLQILLFTNFLLAQQNELGSILENLHNNRRGIIKLDLALSQLKKVAETAYNLDSFSVIFNSPIPPSGDKKDYLSWSPYIWPNEQSGDGLPYVHKDGKTNPETEKLSDKIILRQMATAIHHLSLASYFLNDEKYTKKALSLLNTWFVAPETSMNPNLNFGQCAPGEEKGGAHGIIDSRWLILLVDALDILKAVGKIDSNTDAAINSWLNDYLQWLLSSQLGQTTARLHNNHGSWYHAQVATYANYLGKKELLKFVLNSSKKFFDIQIDSLGRQKLELHRTKSFDYSLYNIHALITLAKLAEQEHIDLWHYKGRKGQGIYKSITYLMNFYLNDIDWPFEQIAEKVIQLSYGDGLHFSVYYPYDLYSAVFIANKIYDDPDLSACLEKLNRQGSKNHLINLLVHTEN